MLELGHPASRTQLSSHHGRLVAPAQAVVDHALWIPPLVQTIASEGKGAEEVVEAIAAHRQFLEGSNLHESVERQHIEIELYERLREGLIARLLKDVPETTIAAVIEQVQARELDPQSAVRQLLAQV